MMAKHLKIREDVTMSDEDTGNEEGSCLSEGLIMKRRRSSSPSFLPSFQQALRDVSVGVFSICVLHLPN